MDYGKVSIAIATFNTLPFIEDTIKCWLNQSYQNIEILIRDDFSSDGTWEYLIHNWHSHPKIRLFRNEENLKQGVTWNRLIEDCGGDYVIKFDGDDYAQRDFIERTIQPFVHDPSIDVVFTAYMATDAKLEKQFYNFKLPETCFYSNDFCKVHDIPEYVPISWTFSLSKKQFLERVRMSNQGTLFLNTRCCDQELLLRAQQAKSKLYYIPEILGYYRWHENNSSRIPYGEFESIYGDLAPRHEWYFELNNKKFRLTLKKLRSMLGYIYHTAIAGRLPKLKVLYFRLKY